MNAAGTVDLSDLRGGMAWLKQHTKLTSAQIVNQTMFDVAANMFNYLAPADAEAKRKEVRNYMNQVVAQRIRLIVTGKRKGRFTTRPKRGQSKNQLKRKHLIMQARRRMMGLPGLYGEEMARFSGAFAGRASRSVGYLAIVIAPVLWGLVDKVKYKLSIRSLTEGISRWPGSRGYGRINPASIATPNSLMQLGWNLSGPRASYARGLIHLGLQHAVSTKVAAIESKARKYLQDLIDRGNRRSR